MLSVSLLPRIQTLYLFAVYLSANRNCKIYVDFTREVPLISLFIMSFDYIISNFVSIVTTYVNVNLTSLKVQVRKKSFEKIWHVKQILKLTSWEDMVTGDHAASVREPSEDVREWKRSIISSRLSKVFYLLWAFSNVKLLFWDLSIINLFPLL